MTSVAIAPVSEPISEPPATATEPALYKFDTAFQSKIVALCIRDTQFLQRTESLIKPEYFENAAEASLVNLVLNYYSKFKKSPDKSLLNKLIKDAHDSKALSRELTVDIIARMRNVSLEDIALGTKPSLFQEDISDRDYVIDQVATFARHQAVSKAIWDSVAYLDKHDFAAIDDKLSKALGVGASAGMRAYSYGEMITARTERRLAKAAGELPDEGITTGYKDFDRHLYHRGWGRRELSVLMGPAKAGKTTALISFALNAAAAKFNVLYATLEVSQDIIAERMDANISNQLVFELGAYTHTIRDEVENFMKKAGRFDIMEFPSGTMRVSDLNRAVETARANGVEYDLIVVDYADLMAPEHFTNSPIENSKSVYVALRAFAMQQNVAVLTATQTNREGAKKTVAGMTDVADDFNKIRIADIVISINKTEEERVTNEARLFFAACRNQRSGFTLRIKQDIDRMRFLVSIEMVE